MSKQITVFLFFLLILVACASESAEPAPTPTKAWYEGGTLHSSTVAEWLDSDDDNHLATAGDWVTVTVKPDTIAETKRISEHLVDCVDESAEVAPQSMKVNELGVSCLILMGYLD